jgi:outer membrane receptor protein involved in Fe transport
MNRSNFRSLRSWALTGVAAAAIASPAYAEDARRFEIPQQSLIAALEAFGKQGDKEILFSRSAAEGRATSGVVGEYEPAQALSMLLDGSGLRYRQVNANTYVVEAADPQSGSAAGDGADAGTVEALIVTAQKREEDIQDVPIAISAFTQEQLERSQVAGGPDLMTQVPNMTFTKTNFSSYSIQLRGIGTQAISATTDAAVAVAFNNTPFIRNRFFEQEFYDLQRVEVLRGPQGTLYGRNATAGVVNLISQKPKFAYEAKLSADVSNYSSTRLEGMLNIPLAEDKVALRLAGAWTKREGFVTNEISGNQIDGRDLWSTRLSLRVAPTDGIDVNLIWEHFQERDDRLRSGKQLCHQDDRETLGYLTVTWSAYGNFYSQGCLPSSLYSPDSFEAPNGLAMPYYAPLGSLGIPIKPLFDPYASIVQSSDLRVIESTIDPKYTAKSDLVELQWSADIGDALTLTSETAYLYDTIYSLQDFNRFNTERGAFENEETAHAAPGDRLEYITPGEFGGVFCDPQLGCLDRLVAVDVSRAKSSHFSEEIRLASNYDGAFNFSLGANFLRYDTEEKYYVFVNTLTMVSASGVFGAGGPLSPYIGGVTDNHECFENGFVAPNPNTIHHLSGCRYIDPNPIESVNDLGHNYFLSKNPYKLISYAVFGEAYYDITDNLKLTAGLRWTVDKKEAPRIPSMLLAGDSVGLSVLAVQEQEWREPTGRLALDWKPDLAFTDETLLYASYAHGYKAGGSNPPPAAIVGWTEASAQAVFDQSVTKPKIFDAEFVDAFELGAKNTLLDGRMTLNLAAFYYDYQGYQISQIIDRSAVNYNFDSTVWGLEVEADWRPVENLRLGFKGGYEQTRVADGERAIDIMERNAGHGPDSDDPWIVIRPFPTFSSNCVLPLYMFDNGQVDFNEPPLRTMVRPYTLITGNMGPCEDAYLFGQDPVTRLPYVPNPTEAIGFTAGISVPIEEIGFFNYPGFNPNDASLGHNHGEGFFKELGGNELPNAPHFTATITADYTVPLPADWLMTLHTDLYYQSEAWTRVFNMEGYDKLKAYSNVNVAAIFTNEDAGWKVMAYVKNVLDKDNITGAFLNSDDTGLTTNVFLTEPRLYGLRVTKEWNGGPWWTGANQNHAGPYPLTVEISGQVQRQDAPYATVGPDFLEAFSDAVSPANVQHRDLDWGDGREVRLVYRPDGTAWSIAAAIRQGRANKKTPLVHASETGPVRCAVLSPYDALFCDPASSKYSESLVAYGVNWSDTTVGEREEHLLADFAVGSDLGIGILGISRSTVAAGLRYAQFDSTTQTTIDGVPDFYLPEGWFFSPTTSRSHYRAFIDARREFTGAGPTLSWEAAQRLLGNDQAGHLNLDWRLTGGVLFGKQKTATTGAQEGEHVTGKYIDLRKGLADMTPVDLDVPARSTDVTVPVVDLSLGLSYEIGRFKAGAGYRWERYFDVLDVGYDEHKDADRTIDGPYFKIAVGFGG